MTSKIGYVWHLRRLMADRGMFATTDLVPLLAERGIGLSRAQVYRRSYSAGLSVGGSHAPVVKSWRRASSLSSPHLVAVSR